MSKSQKKRLKQKAAKQKSESKQQGDSGSNKLYNFLKYVVTTSPSPTNPKTLSLHNGLKEYVVEMEGENAVLRVDLDHCHETKAVLETNLTESQKGEETIVQKSDNWMEEFQGMAR